MSPRDRETVVDFNQIRQEKMDEKRRKTERVLFKNLLGIYTVSDDNSDRLRPIELVDVSEDGLSFVVPHDESDVWPKSSEGVVIRLYFSQETFLPVRVNIRNSSPYLENGVRYIRYGCRLDSTLSSHDAYVRFVQFIKAYAEHSHQDQGRVSFYYI